MQKTCAFLAAAGDLERLRRYVGTLRQAFGTDPRWAIFNRQLAGAAGELAADLRAEGLLDEPCPQRPRHRSLAASFTPNETGFHPLPGGTGSEVASTGHLAHG